MTSLPAASLNGPYSADLELAWELAELADEITMGRYLADDLQIETKPDLSPVTEADKAVEQALRDAIAKAFPDDFVAGEEYGGMTNGVLPPGRVWIIDPIDGTKNYVRGVPVWATLIGLIDNGLPVVGVVSAPAMSRRWWAQPGAGAWVSEPGVGGSLNIRQIRVSKVRELSDASFSYSDRIGWAERTRRPHVLAEFCDSVWRTRAYGDFYSHMLVAEGAVDIAAEPALNAWDVAALVPIVEEAGGTMTGLEGDQDVFASFSGLTTNTLLHAQAVEALRPAH